VPPPIGTTREARWPDTLPGLHGVAVVKTEIVLRIPALGSEFVVATVYADTAGGRSGQARDRDLAEAWALAEQLAVRARHARGLFSQP